MASSPLEKEPLVTSEVEEVETPENDPWYYGWRPQVRIVNGRKRVRRVPLTLEDVLHPQEDDHVTHSDWHQRVCVYLYNVLRAHLAHDATAVVLHDVRVAWGKGGPKPHGPDITVIFGVREQQNWGTFHVSREGTRPAMLIEVTSEKTRKIDYNPKVEEYHQARVPLYIIVDLLPRQDSPPPPFLQGYQYAPGAYEPLAPDERGWLWLAPVGLWLGVRGGQVELYAPDGTLMGDYTSIVAERDAAAAQAAVEAEARRAAEAEAEAQAKARRDAQAHAQAEAEARRAAEARLHELEAEIKRLRGEA
jgi:Uma2 family endonuclease